MKISGFLARPSRRAPSRDIRELSPETNTNAQSLMRTSWDLGVIYLHYEAMRFGRHQ
jgi:hypothetical protein